MLMIGLGAAAVAGPLGSAHAQPAPVPVEPPPVAGQTGPVMLFQDEFDGHAGAPPNPANWFIVPARETIKNPTEWDKPFNMGRYVTDQEHVFQDGDGNLVIRATR